MRAETARTHQALVASALQHIQRDLESDLGLDSLAERLGVSPFHFHRLFTAIVGEPPASYVRRLRLERAALRLKYSRRPVTDIAFEAGYETHEAFTRSFKSTFGLPPSGFRARKRPPIDGLDVEPSIVRVPSRRIAYVRHVGPYDESGRAFEKVIEWARPRDLLAGAPLLGIFWDDQTITPPERTRCEVGLVVGEHVVGDGEVFVRQLLGGDYAVIRHHGTAHERRRIYDHLYSRWLHERGREAAYEPPIEEYWEYRDRLDRIDRVTSVHIPLVPTA